MARCLMSSAIHRGPGPLFTGNAVSLNKMAAYSRFAREGVMRRGATGRYEITSTTGALALPAGAAR